MKELKILENAFKNLGVENLFDDIFKFIEIVEGYNKKSLMTKEEFLENVNPFLEQLKVLIPNLKVKFYGNTLYLFDDDLSNGFGMITYSPEKNRYHCYILTNSKRIKVCSANDKDLDVLKYIKYFIKYHKDSNEKRDLTNIFNQNKKFNKKLFIKNIEKDLNVKIYELKIDYDINKDRFKFCIDYIENKDIRKIYDYIYDYLNVLVKKGIEIPYKIQYERKENE